MIVIEFFECGMQPRSRAPSLAVIWIDTSHELEPSAGLQSAASPYRWLSSRKTNALPQKTAICKTDAQAAASRAPCSGHPGGKSPGTSLTQLNTHMCH